MGDLANQHQRLQEHHLAFFGEVPVLFHCHHFNLFLDQTIDDALGHAEGTRLRIAAAQESGHALLLALTKGTGAETPMERINLAQQVFSAMGHGKLQIDAPEGRGTAQGTYLHYGFSWAEKYGKDVKRRHPADAFAAGFAAAAVEVAYDLPCESVRVTESRCVAMREDACEFTLEPSEPASSATSRPRVDLAATKDVLVPSRPGLHEERIEEIAQGLIEFLGGVGPDSRGLIQGFGVFITMHLAGYYNRLSYDAVERVRERAPGLLGVLEALLRESGQVCVFHTFGGILLSPEWEGLVGKPTGDVTDHVIGCCAIARALGFGRWTIDELDADRRLVLRTPLTYETAYHLRRHGKAPGGSSYFLQGAAAAFMELAHRVPWRDDPQLSDAFYRQLFSRGQTWRVEQTSDLAKGDDQCEVVVSRID